MRRIKRHRRQNKREAQPTSFGQDWSRSGAHNIAGVSFQVAVTARLLVDARSGQLPLTRATPEGFEDIDLELQDEVRALVQVKERSPSNRFARSDLVDALMNKSTVLTENPDCRFVLATNATLGGGLSATGWDQPLSQYLDKADADALAVQLEASFGDPYEILDRTHILQVGWDVVEASRRDFGLTLQIPPSVAVLAYSRLVEQITEIAVRQRSTSPNTTEWIAPSELDALAKRVLDTVDVDSLDEAVRVGIIEPVDFSVRAALSVEDFLAGVDVLPAHIAADLDLPRPNDAQAVISALQSDKSALLTGPSGSGKSTLVWRTARELSGRMRPYRLLRILPEDVPILSRWIRIQEPSNSFPLLLCADNLGRPDRVGWAALATEFIARPGVFLLGACREEDYHPSLVVGRTTIVDPALDHTLAASIASALADRQIGTVLDADEAFQASEGLLMEFLSMLLTGRRLQQIIEQQMAARLVEGKATERDIIRYVATAHSAGVSLPVAVLERMLPDRDLAPALAVLQREHVLIADGGTRWRGLHELRSTVARNYLHQFPPPTAATTIGHLVEHLPATDARRIVEDYARLDDDLAPAIEAISTILRSQNVSAEDGAQLVGSLAMADAYHHARECLRVIEGLRPPGLDPETVLLLSYTHRFAGVSFDSLKNISPGFTRLTEIANALPARPPSFRDMSLQNLSPDAILAIAIQGSPEQTIEWIESLEGSVAAQSVTAKEVWLRLGDAPLNTKARLLAALRSLNPAEGAPLAADDFGDLNQRIHRLASDLPDCLDAVSKDESDGKVVTVHLLVPEDEATLHERSIETCRLILDLCPEADIAEVIVLTPDGDRYSVGDLETGHKRIPRTNLPRPTQVAINADFIRAGRLLLASRYWTEPIRVLAETSRQLLDLRNDAVAWLINPHHNGRRRREAVTLITSLVNQLTGSPREPVGDGDSKDRSSAREALTEALSVVRDIAARPSPSDQDRRRFGARCRSAVKRLGKAREGNLPKLSSVGDPLPDSLDDMLALLANVLLAQAEHSGASVTSLRRRTAETWPDVAGRFVEEAAASAYQTELQALETAAKTLTPNFKADRVRNPETESARFPTDWWVVLIPAEDDATPAGEDATPPLFADSLAADMAEQLAFRTFIVFEANGRLLPLNAVKFGVPNSWPADENDLLFIASQLGTEVMQSSHVQVWDHFVAELVAASRAATLLRLRKQVGLTGDQQAFGARLSSARAAVGECHSLLQGEASRLLDRVEQEPDGDQQTLAGEVYRSLTHAELGDDVAALNKLRIAALTVDL